MTLNAVIADIAEKLGEAQRSEETSFSMIIINYTDDDSS
jgi:hypothetical protein